jgi:hypothetical protein
MSLIGELVLKLRKLKNTPHLYIRKRKKLKKEINDIKNKIYNLDFFDLSTYAYSVLIGNSRIAEEFNIKTEDGMFEFKHNRNNIYFSSTFRIYEIETYTVKFTYTIGNNSPLIEKKMETLIPELREIYYDIIDSFVWEELIERGD